MVVLVHTNQHLRPGIGAWWPWGAFVGPFYSVSVPTFLILSGLFAAKEGRVPTRDDLLRRVRRLVPPYLFWNMVLVLVCTLRGPWYKDLLLGAAQMYYVAALLQLLALSAWIEPRLGRRAVIPFVVLALAVSGAVYALSSYLLWSRGGDGGAFESDARRILFPWVGYYAIGVALRRIEGATAWVQSATPWLLAATLLAWIPYVWELRLQDAVYRYDSRQQFLLGGFVMQSVGPLALLSTLHRLQATRPVRWLARFADATFGVYLVHTTVLWIFYGVLRDLGLTTVRSVEVPLVALGVGILSLSIVRLARSLPRPVRGLFGVR